MKSFNGSRVATVLYRLHLWQPARFRRHVRRPTTPGRPLPAQDVNKPHRRSADRSLLVGWLNIQSLTNKTDDVQAVISERSLDILALTETWHSASDDVRLRLATPDDYAVVEAARSTLYRSRRRCRHHLPKAPSILAYDAVVYHIGGHLRAFDNGEWPCHRAERLSAGVKPTVVAILR